MKHRRRRRHAPKRHAVSSTRQRRERKDLQVEGQQAECRAMLVCWRLRCFNSNCVILFDSHRAHNRYLLIRPNRQHERAATQARQRQTTVSSRALKARRWSRPTDVEKRPRRMYC